MEALVRLALQVLQAAQLGLLALLERRQVQRGRLADLAVPTAIREQPAQLALPARKLRPASLGLQAQLARLGRRPWAAALARLAQLAPRAAALVLRVRRELLGRLARPE